ncbi:DUF2334 domain-containing protein [Ralstonia pickettii]|jgi:uncharacterized protein YdaL|uniref:Papd-like protein n=3 Tax=Ralstonia TaxID=48736 RepID=C6BLB6_RALP1|nr:MULTISPECIES: DUF2334 domain-containing protein [Ralstonia]MDE2204305.1 DUF2334 domain-containing protein [Burkholderiaceae bacterium]MBA9883121.1 DUF2334 domain-containing protein [Ralstonia pickettii]MBA9892897.1 DUF2334 domain-containing protein [Ralstonia pickettii]MBA9925088.1 DUF2334 domain-containing protein [Ralstonia pickettii]MBB0093591.1 DUF2334 domain-containing protein [Ralstonia pickettii]
MKTLLGKFLCVLVFAGSLLGVSVGGTAQTSACTIGIGPVCVTVGATASAQTTPAKMLVLYDAPPNDQYTNLGKAYAIMLYNLLAHFNTTITLLPVQNYTAGMTEQYAATFYMGSYYNNPIPAAFLSDVTTTQKTVVWFKYNLWELAWNTAYPFTSRYGINFVGLRGLNAAPSASAPNPGFFDTVSYKNLTMTKYYAYNATTGAISADPDIGVTSVADATKATSLVTITNSVTQETAPYVMRSGNFWYFADMPFSYIGPRDRYLAMCDLLHDILGTNQATLHRAMVRLEDVNATTTVSSMKTLTDYLYSKKIPFSIATIPLYTDPNGVYNGGVAQTIHLVNATGLKQALNYAQNRGGRVLMHGYTHQYSNIPNLINAVSANDFEFWLATENRPVNEDSTQWAAGRLSAGLLEFQLNGYFPFAWEAPHYQSSPLSIKAVPQYFKTTYQRVVYYTSDNPQTLNSTTAGHDFSVGQFFPYIIQKDYYNQRVLPENLGNVEYNICNIDPSSCLTYTAQDILTNANYALAVRDGFASFFFHPFWLEPDLGTPGFTDFQTIISGITSLGFTWADASKVQ